MRQSDPTKVSGITAEERRLLENYAASRVGRIPELVGRLLAERDALVLVAEAVVNGEWEAARELSDAALERLP